MARLVPLFHGLFSASLAAAGAVTCLAAAVAAAERPAPANLLVIYSHHETMPWQRLFDKGFKDRLAEGRQPAKVFVERMDKARFRDLADGALLAQFLTRKYAGTPIDVVVTEDLEAARFMQENWEDFGSPKVVFSTTHHIRIPEAMKEAAVRLPVSTDHRHGLEIALALQPGPRRVVVVSDGTPGGRHRLETAKSAWTGLEGRAAFEYLTDFELSENGLLRRLSRLPEDALIYYLLVFQDNTGATFVPRDVVALIAEHANAPVYSHWDPLLGAGLMGGYMVSAELAGRVSADIAAQLLAGRAPADIAVTTADARGYFFDWRQLQRWGIEERHLPRGSIIRHRQPGLWEEHRWRILGAIVLFLIQAALIVGLLVHRASRRKVMEELQQERALLESRVEERTRELRASEENHRTLFDDAADAILMATPDGLLIDANKAAREMLGYSLDELLTMNFRQIHPQEELERTEQAFMGLVVEGHGKMDDAIVLRKDGSLLPVEIKGRLFRLGDRPVLQGIFRDVSDRRQTELELVRAKEEAERASAAKSRFLAAASHDLRQPLQALRLFAATLAEHLTRGDIELAESLRLLGKLELSIDTLGGLLNSLLDVSKLDAGIVVPSLSVFAVGEVLERSASEFATAAQIKDVSLAVVPTSVMVRSDKALLGRILDNLVSNAIRYTLQGRVLIGVRRGRGRIRIQVWDTGTGIPADRRNEIFEEFRQLDNEARQRGEGLGLGLAIVLRTARLLGHEIHVDSTLGKGSVFTVEVPEADAATLAAPILAPEMREPRTSPPLVLVVEDDAQVRESTGTLLRQWGYRAVLATDVPDVRRLCREAPEKPDLVIADYRLPGDDDGVAAVLAAGTLFHARIPGIIITGDTGADSLTRISSSGLEHLHKPVVPARLRALIRNVIARSPNT